MSAWARVVRCWWIFPVGLFWILRLFGESSVYVVRSDQCSYLALAQTFPSHRLYNGQLYLIHPPIWGWVVGVFHLALPLVWAGLAATQILAAAYLAVTAIWGRRNRLGHAGMAVAILFPAVQALSVAWDSQVSRFPILIFITTLAFVVFERWMVQLPSSLPPGEGSVCEANAGEGAREGELRNRSTTAADAPSPAFPKETLPSPDGRGNERRPGFPWIVLLVNTLAFLTSDQCLMILPCQAVILALSGQWRRWKPMAGLMALSAVAFLIWPAVRLGVYLTHDAYPAGINGTIEDVRNAPLKAIFQPNLLPRTLEHNNQYTAGEFALANLRGANLRHVWRIIGPRPFALGWIAVALVVLAFVRALRFRNATIDWPDLAISLKLLIVTGLLYLPAAAGLYPWYGIAALVPFALLLGRGVDAIPMLLPRADLAIAWLLALACIPMAAWWLSGPQSYAMMEWSDVRQGGANFLYAREPIVRARKLADRINRLPKDGGAVMAELSMELTVLTGRRSFDVPFDPSELWPIIEQYDVRYIVIDETSRQDALRYDPQRDGAMRRAMRFETYRAILGDPLHFQEVATVQESDSDLPAPDLHHTYRIFRVVR